MRYFHISSGLRGCYMSDDSFMLAAKTRRELKSAVTYECDSCREAYGFGGPKKEINALVAHIWREAKQKTGKPYLPYAIGFGCSREASDRPFGVFIGHATRAEYVEYVKGSDQ